MSLSASKLTAGYDGKRVLDGVDVDIAPGSLTVIVGPNACGKSTLLRTLARALRPGEGTVLLDGKDIAALPARALARRLGLLPQSATAPDGITVHELVSRGRYPHQTALRQWSPEDAAAVDQAMAAVSVEQLASRFVDELSGGQRQRVWLALVLAQQTATVLLDEPTTFLDIAHQHDLLDVCASLRNDGRTLVVVLHDLNQACRYADELIAMREGRVVARGRPADVITPDTVEAVFGLPCRVIEDPETGLPLVIARRRLG
jgi:iron complex transport system ATP-binding protein